jgi:hypothetical protein
MKVVEDWIIGLGSKTILLSETIFQQKAQMLKLTSTIFAI